MGEHKEEKMEFDKSRVFSAVNADELRPGDKVIVANNLADLKEFVRKNDVHEIEDILSDCVNERFGVCGMANYALAYLVERAENCTNCEGCGEGVDPRDERTKIMVCSQYKPKAEINLCDTCKDNFCECPAIGDNIKFGNGKGNDNVIECKCYKPKTEQKAYEYDVPIKGQINEDGVIVERQVGECHVKFKPYTEEAKKAYENVMTKAEKHYRPFKDADELVKTWIAKRMITFPDLCMPHIWVRSKFNKDHKGVLINNYFGEYVELNKVQCFLSRLFDEYTFLDGSPCGVEE